MYPKKEINRLNRNREANKLIKFAHARVLETALELNYARKITSELPTGMRLPPEWALNAAVQVSDRWLAPFKKLSPEAIKADPKGAVREIAGTLDAMTIFMAEIRKEIPERERQKSEFQAISSAIDDVRVKLLRANLRMLEDRLNELFPDNTQKELFAYAERYKKGLSEVFDPDDQFRVIGMRTQTAQITYMVWFFWPLLEKIEPLRASDLKSFIWDHTHMSFGEKLVQKVYSDVGLAHRSNPIDIPT